MSFLSDLIQDTAEMPSKFADVALQGPIEGLLLLVGALFVILPSLVFGYLVLGVTVDLVLPDSVGASFP